MRYIKPHYYDRFRCIADQCPATCCAGWQIVIDEDSLDKYEMTEGAFGNRLRNSIDWEEGVFYQYEGRCAFLNEKDLCDLQSELGEEALCDTCKRYPRHVEEYDGLREYSLSLSCPAAAKIMLEEQEKTRFLEWETDEEDDFEEFDFLMFTQLEDAREVMFDIIRNREIDFRVRMEKVLAFARDLQTCVNEGRSFDVDGVTGRYREWSERASGEKNISAEYGERTDGMEPLTRGETDTSEESYRNKTEEFQVFYKLEHLDRNWTKRLDRVRRILYSQGKNAYRLICAQFEKEYGYQSPNCMEWERIGEQLFMFFVYTYFCGAVYDDMIYTKIAMSVFSVKWIQEFFMALWTQRQGKAGLEDLIEIAYSYAREVEHSDLNLDQLEKWLSERMQMQL